MERFSNKLPAELGAVAPPKPALAGESAAVADAVRGGAAVLEALAP